MMEIGLLWAVVGGAAGGAFEVCLGKPTPLLFNGDCWWMEAAPISTRTSRRDTCESQGARLGLPHWEDAVEAMRVLHSGLSPYINLLQKPGSDGVANGWYWILPSGEEVHTHNSTTHLQWASGPNDSGGGEDGQQDDAQLVSTSTRGFNDAGGAKNCLCQAIGQRNLSQHTYESCESSGAKMSLPTSCVRMLKDFVIRGDEARDGDVCGPFGHVAVLPTRALLDQAQADIVNAEGAHGLIGLFQETPAASVSDKWFWRLPDGSKDFAVDPAIWSQPYYPEDSIWTSGVEDGEMNFGYLWQGESGVLSLAAIHKFDPVYPICQFPVPATSTTSTTRTTSSTTTTTTGKSTSLTTSRVQNVTTSKSLTFSASASTSSSISSDQFHACLNSGGQLYNSDCFVAKTPTSADALSRNAACAAIGGFPAVAYWLGAVTDLGYTLANQPGIVSLPIRIMLTQQPRLINFKRVYIGLFRQYESGNADPLAFWYWRLHDGTEAHFGNGLYRVNWKSGGPATMGSYGIFEESFVHETSDNNNYDVLCQVKDWCLGAGFTADGSCYSLITERIITGAETPGSCGPHGALAVLNSLPLFTQALQIVNAAGSIMGAVSLFQDAAATSIPGDWNWLHPNGTKEPILASLWRSSNTHPYDSLFTSIEDGEVQNGYIFSGLSDGFVSAAGIHQFERKIYPLCQFQELGEKPSTAAKTTGELTTEPVISTIQSSTQKSSTQKHTSEPETTVAPTSIIMPTPGMFDLCISAGGKLYNSDCFIEQVPAAYTIASRDAACSAVGGFPAVAYWAGAAVDLGYSLADAPGIRVYIGLYQKYEFTNVNPAALWYWELHDGSEAHIWNTGDRMEWKPGQPTDGSGAETGYTTICVFKESYVQETTENLAYNVLCQIKGQPNLTSYDFDWCGGSGFSVGSFCYSVVTERIINGAETDGACGPHGDLAVLNALQLFTAAYAHVSALGTLVAAVSLFQDTSASSIVGDWFWHHPNGDKEPMDASLWRSAATHPHDDLFNIGEDGEVQNGYIFSGLSDGFVSYSGIYTYSRRMYPLCQFRDPSAITTMKTSSSIQYSTSDMTTTTTNELKTTSSTVIPLTSVPTTSLTTPSSSSTSTSASFKSSLSRSMSITSTTSSTTYFTSTSHTSHSSSISSLASIRSTTSWTSTTFSTTSSTSTYLTSSTSSATSTTSSSSTSTTSTTSTSTTTISTTSLTSSTSTSTTSSTSSSKTSSTSTSTTSTTTAYLTSSTSSATSPTSSSSTSTTSTTSTSTTTISTTSLTSSTSTSTTSSTSSSKTSSKSTSTTSTTTTYLTSSTSAATSTTSSSSTSTTSTSTTYFTSSTSSATSTTSSSSTSTTSTTSTSTTTISTTSLTSSTSSSTTSSTSTSTTSLTSTSSTSTTTTSLRSSTSTSTTSSTSTSTTSSTSTSTTSSSSTSSTSKIPTFTTSTTSTHLISSTSTSTMTSTLTSTTRTTSTSLTSSTSTSTTTSTSTSTTCSTSKTSTRSTTSTSITTSTFTSISKTETKSTSAKSSTSMYLTSSTLTHTTSVTSTAASSTSTFLLSSTSTYIKISTSASTNSPTSTSSTRSTSISTSSSTTTLSSATSSTSLTSISTPSTSSTSSKTTFATTSTLTSSSTWSESSLKTTRSTVRSTVTTSSTRPTSQDTNSDSSTQSITTLSDTSKLSPNTPTSPKIDSQSSTVAAVGSTIDESPTIVPKQMISTKISTPYPTSTIFSSSDIPTSKHTTNIKTTPSEESTTISTSKSSTSTGSQKKTASERLHKSTEDPKNPIVAIANLLQIARDDIPGPIAAAIVNGETEKATAWVAEQDTPISDAAMAELKSKSVEYGLDSELVDAIEEWQANQISAEESLELAKLLKTPEGLPKEVLEELKDGKPGALTNFMKDQDIRPNPEDWTSFEGSEQYVLLPPALRQALAKMKASTLPQSAVTAVGAFVASGTGGKSLPDSIISALDGGDPGPLLSWLAQEDARPSEAQWDAIRRPGTLPPELLRSLEAWEAARKLSPEGKAELGRFTGRDLPPEIVAAVDDGDYETFTKWLEEAGVRTTKQQRERLAAGGEVFNLPPKLLAEVAAWSDDKWLAGAVGELNKFAGQEVPAPIVKAAEAGDSRPFIAWLDQEAIEPGPGDLIRLRKQSGLVEMPPPFVEDVEEWFARFGHVFTSSEAPTTPPTTEKTLGPGETTTPPFPLSAAEAVATSVMQSLGCGTLLAILGATLGGYALIVRDPSIERFLHMNQEAALFLAHVLVLSMRDRVAIHVPCQLVSIALQSLFISNFAFMALEAFQAYTISSSVIGSEGVFNKKQFAAIGWLLPAVYSGATAMFLSPHYTSYWSCWLNLGHGVSMATFVPIGILSGSVIVMVEAGGMQDDLPPQLGADAFQRTAAMANQKGLLFVLPAAVGSWFVGLLAVFEANVALYGLVFALNLTLALAIFTFHTLGNPKVHSWLTKVFPCI